MVDLKSLLEIKYKGKTLKKGKLPNCNLLSNGLDALETGLATLNTLFLLFKVLRIVYQQVSNPTLNQSINLENFDKTALMASQIFPNKTNSYKFN